MYRKFVDCCESQSNLTHPPSVTELYWIAQHGFLVVHQSSFAHLQQDLEYGLNWLRNILTGQLDFHLLFFRLAWVPLRLFDCVPHCSRWGTDAGQDPAEPFGLPISSLSVQLCINRCILKEAEMDDIFTQCREGNAVAVRLWLDNTENDLNQGWAKIYSSRYFFFSRMLMIHNLLNIVIYVQLIKLNGWSSRYLLGIICTKTLPHCRGVKKILTS